MTEIDTSAEAVERMAHWIERDALRDDLLTLEICQAKLLETCQAKLVAERDRLAAERDALREALREIKETKGGARLDYAELVRVMRGIAGSALAQKEPGA